MSLGAIISIIRPLNSVMIGFAVIVGAFVSRAPSIIGVNLLLGFVTGFSICAYSMVINDYYDIEVDRINQPTRPLPSGKISPRGASYVALFMLIIGLASSVITGIAVAVLISALYAFLSWLYNYRAKKYGLAGNAIVASSLAIPFIYGGAITLGHVVNSLLLSMALTSFLAGVGREVVKAMADTAGDARRGIRSFAISHGMRSAAVVGALLFLSAVVASLLPVLSGFANQVYRFGVVVPDLIFIYLAASILRRWNPENAVAVKKNALLGMLVGLIVFIGGAL